MTVPARRWASDEVEPEPAPVVLVSSRDGHEVPPVRGVASLVKAAQAAGWTVGVTYALAQVADHYYLNGNLAKAAYRLASVVVRLRRGAVRVWAAWHREGDGPFAFVCAYAGFTRLQLRRGKGDGQYPLISDVIGAAA